MCPNPVINVFHRRRSEGRCYKGTQGDGKENGVIHLPVKECQGLVKERDSLIFIKYSETGS